MTMRYRKKPVVIEAFQMTRERRQIKVDWPWWLVAAWDRPHAEVGAVWPIDFPKSDGQDQLCVRTLEGVMTIGWDDWIIRGVAGELYACKPDIFAATYEPASNGDEQCVRIGRFLLRVDLLAQVKDCIETALNANVSDEVVTAFLLRNAQFLGAIVAYDEIDTEDRHELWLLVDADHLLRG